MLPSSAARVAERARSLGLDARIVEMAASTRTAEEAAAACGCAVGQIVKSLVFRGRSSGQAYLLLVSGANRVDPEFVASALGEALDRPDAGYVREVTGFAIGGIPPFGHDRLLATYLDRDLLRYREVWAAAGTPRCVMPLDPARLSDAIQARIIAVRPAAP
jgi:prolyl-tRNA editing enzyme YbaK/EbsC (Cys-tRNA(Pro) deacylase)